GVREEPIGMLKLDTKGPPSLVLTESWKLTVERHATCGSMCTRKCGASLTVGTPGVRFGHVALPSRIVTPGVALVSTPLTPVRGSAEATTVTRISAFSPGSSTPFTLPGMLLHSSVIAFDT